MRSARFGKAAAGAVKLAVLSLGGLVLSGCSGNPTPRSDEDKLVLATLILLAAKGETVCVDNRTAGHPLTVFATMMNNRPDGLKPLRWFQPTGLRPLAAMSNGDLMRSARSDATVHINQPANASPPIDPVIQAAIDHDAAVLARRANDRQVIGFDAWHVRGVQARWWLLNRFTPRCFPNYRITNPAVGPDVGFVSVTAEHWGTTYAFSRRGAEWVVTAQWSNWMY